MRHRTAPRRLVLENGVALAEIARRTFEGNLSKRAGRRFQIIQIGRVRRQRVVTIDAVFRQKLPVGTHRIFLRAADDRHSGLGLVANHVEIFFDRAQVVREAFDVLVEADEIKITIAIEAWNLLHVGGRALLEILCIGRLAGLAAQRPVQAEYPAMIETLERFRAAMLLAANLCAAMRAGVEHRPEIAPAVAGEQDISAPDRTGDKVAGLGEFGTVPEIEPAFVENLRALDIQNGGIDKSLTGDLEDLSGFIDQKRCLHRPNSVHRRPPLISLFSLPGADRTPSFQCRIG